MSYITIHLISDLFLGFNEFSVEEECIPDVDLVIINGNIGAPKRSMFYAERLCAKYPDTQFVYNFGETELYSQSPPCKYINELRDQTLNRKKYNKSWPKNLHYNYDSNMLIKCRNNQVVDVYTLYGFPNLLKINESWQNTNWYRYYFKELIPEEEIPINNPFKPKETSNVNHGVIWVPADVNFINDMYQKEFVKVKKWEMVDNHCYKILVTHINPINDTRLTNQKYNPFAIHMYDKNLWLTANRPYDGVKFNGCRLFSNSGRGEDKRCKIITID